MQVNPDDVTQDPNKFKLDNALMDVLVHDKHQFVPLFLECGVNLKNFIKSRLDDLYDQVCSREHCHTLLLPRCTAVSVWLLSIFYYTVLLGRVVTSSRQPAPRVGGSRKDEAMQQGEIIHFSGWSQCFEFLSVLWHCCLTDSIAGHRACKNRA